jgi:hypothetical protein
VPEQLATAEAEASPGDALTSHQMTDEEQDQQRADRNHERSEEAHWQVAEAGAEEEDRLLAARQSDKQKDDWENEGGALDREPRKTTEQGDENPVPKLGNLKKVSEPERK